MKVETFLLEGSNDMRRILSNGFGTESQVSQKTHKVFNETGAHSGGMTEECNRDEEGDAKNYELSPTRAISDARAFAQVGLESVMENVSKSCIQRGSDVRHGTVQRVRE